MVKIVLITDLEDKLMDVLVEGDTKIEVLSACYDTGMEPELVKTIESPEVIKEAFEKYANQKKNAIISSAMSIKNLYTNEELALFIKTLKEKK